MNEAQLHLALNHFPVTGLFLGTLVYLTALIVKSQDVKKVGLALLTIACLAALPTYLTGEGAEEIVEEFADVDHHVIHEHEEAALPFIVVMSVLGVLSLASFILLWLRQYSPRWLVIVVAVVSLFCCTVAARVNHTGGLIRHPELSGERAPSSQEHHHEEDHHDEHE